jgi:hypothetical protein
MSALTAWSYSRLSLWETCPAAFKYKNIDKLTEEQSPAMKRGDDIHKAAAAFISGVHQDFPVELAKFDTQIWELRDAPADDRVVEQQWGFNKDWRATGWFGKDTWLRVVLDVGVVYSDGTGDVIDHKTGKVYESNKDQRELNAIAMLRRFPHLSQVTSRLWYLDSGKETLAEYLQEDITSLIMKWEKRVEPMFADRVFAPRPSEKCRWCAYAKSKGGVCRFG